MIDYRSDTVTRPTPEMLEFMLRAPLGDDVFGEDPTVNELERFAADIFGMEAGLFCPSGTMTNQIGIKLHTQPGDEVICDRSAHIFQYEGGGIAYNSGCQVNLAEAPRGLLTADDVLARINNTEDVHKARTSLVSLENTSNRGGGACFEFEEIEKIAEVCKEHNLKFHLDGARLFNALEAKQETAKQYGEVFDSISICLSKGLGAPVGSVLVGSADFIKRGRRVRKVFGGGMRQAGVIAAGGLFALQNNRERLVLDHIHARQITDELLKKDWVGHILPVETNIIIFEVKLPGGPATFRDKMAEQGIKVMVISPTQIRIVTHLDIDKEMVAKTIEAIKSW